MKIMKYLLVALLLGGALYSTTVNRSYGWGGSGSVIAGADGWFYTNVTASSGTIFTGAGYVGAIYVSTGNGADYAVGYDTSPLAGVSATTYANSQRVTPAVLFSSGTIGGQPVSFTGNTLGWQSPLGLGTRVTNGFYVLKTVAASGEANQVTVYWRR